MQDKINAELIGLVVAEVKSPVLVGRIAQICASSYKDEDKMKAVARMYLEPDICRLCAIDIASAVGFFVALSERTALSIVNEIRNELLTTGYPIADGRPTNGMRSVPEFQNGCTVGFLKGMAKSKEYSLQTQRSLGADLAQMLKLDSSKEIASGQCVGELSTSTSAVFEKHPAFVTRFLDGVGSLAELMHGAYALTIINNFLHKVLNLEEFTLTEKVSVLTPINNRIQAAREKKKPLKLVEGAEFP